VFLVKKKILIGIAVLVAALAGPVVAWQLVDDSSRRQGALEDTTTPGPVSGWQIVEPSMTIPGFQKMTIIVECPVGKKVFGGGFHSTASLGVEVNAPVTGYNHGGVTSRIGRAWYLRLWNGNATAQYGKGFAICANASS
jgi:hypothetical protein